MRRRRSTNGTELSRITATISPAVYDAMEKHRLRQDQTRSAFIEEALADRVARIEANDLERLSGIAEVIRRLEVLAELLGEVAASVGDRVDRQADRISRVVERDRWATETLYHLIEHQLSPDLSRRQARELAARSLRRERNEGAPDA